MKNPIYGKTKNVPNHQSVFINALCAEFQHISNQEEALILQPA
jgi:hypothetical protein